MNIFPSDKVIKNDDGSLRMVFDVEEGVRITLTFSEMEHSKGAAIDCVLMAVVHMNDRAWPFSGHINLLSLSSRETFARQLGKSLDRKLPLEMFLSRAIDGVLTYVRNQDSSVGFEEIDAKLPEKPLFDPILVQNAPNLLFGKGGTGKSYLGLRIAVSLATGVPFLGMAPVKMCNTLFVDFEDSPDEFYHRINRLIGGMGSSVELEQIMGKLRYMKPTAPLHEILPALKKIVYQHRIGFVLVDSAILACGGEPEKADVAARYFATLAQLGVTTLTIAHETKAENHAYPFGSVVWWNSPRNIWNAQGLDTDLDEDEEANLNMPIELGLFHRKSNAGSRSRMIAGRIEFGEGTVSVGFGNRAIWTKEVSVSTRILRFLRRVGVAGKKDIEGELSDVEKANVKQNLHRLVEGGKIELIGGQGGEYKIKSK